MSHFHPKMQAQIFQAQQGRGFLSSRADSTSALYNSFSCVPSPIDHSFAWSGFDHDASAQNVWSTRWQSFVGPMERQNQACCLATRAFSSGRALQVGSFHKAPSLPDSPMSYSATRSVLISRPAALAVLLRLRRPAGLGFQRKNLPAAAAHKAGEIFLRSLPESTAAALGSEAHSRRFAQECPEANPGKYNKEK